MSASGPSLTQTCGLSETAVTSFASCKYTRAQRSFVIAPGSAL